MFRSRIYRGQVYHRRTRPTVHTLRYRTFSLYLDLEEIDTLSSRLKLFSRNCFGLFSFYDADHGDGLNESVPEYVQRTLREAGVTQIPERTFLLCYPRILGYVFNPLSVFYCLAADGSVFAVLLEVHNTFGERHTYVLPAVVPADTAQSVSSEQWIKQECGKVMHVSPFTPMHMNYQFRLNRPDSRMVLVIRALNDEGLMLTASTTGKLHLLSDRSLFGCLMLYPFMTLKITAGIHWEALKLWFKRVPYFQFRPKSRRSDRT